MVRYGLFKREKLKMTVNYFKTTSAFFVGVCLFCFFLFCLIFKNAKCILNKVQKVMILYSGKIN